MNNHTVEFDLPQNNTNYPIKVIGVGGGGGNAVNHMFKQDMKGVTFILCNTDEQVLERSNVPIKVILGSTLTRGRGAGNDPKVGEQAAIESLPEIEAILKGSVTDMVFITAGMGGGTGTGAAPVIAKAAKDLNILTVAVVSIPDRDEGPKRFNQALEGVNKLRKHVDSLLVVDNKKIDEIYGDCPIDDAYGKADEVLATAVRGIADIINMAWEVNIDMADVKTTMKDSQVALMGTGIARGENRIIEATAAALHSPLLNDNNISNAQNILLHIAYNEEKKIKSNDAKECRRAIQAAAGGAANLIWGHGADATLGDDEVKITVIATGFDSKSTLDNLQGITSVAPKNEPAPMPLFEQNFDDNTTKHGQFIEQDSTPAYKTLPSSDQVRIFGNNAQNNSSYGKGIVSSPDDDL